MRRAALPIVVLALLGVGLAVWPQRLTSRVATSPDFVHFESPHVHPACMTPAGNRLLVVNTADNRLSVFDLSQGPPRYSSRIAEIPVGLEPVSVAALSDSEAWVINQLSDDVSIVNLDTRHVKATLRVGDEPADVVFAGTPTRAYVSLMQEDVVKVYDPVTRALETSIAIDGRMPRSLAKTPDGTKVYVAMFQAGNLTSILSPADLPNDSIPQDPSFPKDTANGDPPKTGLVVQYQSPGGPAGAGWYDTYGNLWSSKLQYTMADVNVAEIATSTNTVSRTFGGSTNLLNHIGSHHFAIAVNPIDSRIGVANWNSRNLFRFEPAVIGYLVETQVSWITQAGTIFNRKLDPHINYNVVPGTQLEADSAIGLPTGIAFSSNGQRAYVTSMATNKIAVANPAGGPLSTIKARVPTLEGPTGIVVDDAREQIYVIGRFRNEVQTLSTEDFSEQRLSAIGFDPTPDDIVHGRRIFYGGFGSAHGDQSCVSCHVFGDADHLAWDLGDPGGAYAPAPPGQPDLLLQGFHPMKGPLMTQSLRGLPGTGVLHWRGDRQDFAAFNGAFTSLMGRSDPLPDSQMTAMMDFVNALTYPPNPNRYLDRTLRDAPVGEPSAQRGETFFHNTMVMGTRRCVDCHSTASFGPGTNGFIVNHTEMQDPQDFKPQQLRNLYTRSGFRDTAAAINKAGYGFSHDGSIDNLMNFLAQPRFVFLNGDPDRQDVLAYLLSFDSGIAPAVGYQLTFDGANNSDPTMSARMDTLEAQAALDYCDLVAWGRVGTQQRSWTYGGGGMWKPDKAAQSDLTRAQLIATAELGTELTVTGVPNGSGTRMGNDRDRDGYLDGDERDALCDPGNPASTPLNVGVEPGARPIEGLRAVGPNPSRGPIAIELALGRGGTADLVVFDVLGREVRALLRGAVLPAGVRSLSWDGRDARGKLAGAGVYFVKLRTDTGSWTRTVIRLQ